MKYVSHEYLVSKEFILKQHCLSQLAHIAPTPPLVVLTDAFAATVLAFIPPPVVLTDA